MIEVAIMIEGQNGLTWPRWQRIAAVVEELGFVGLYRSDHYTNAGPPDMESLEMWVSLVWLASHTKRLEFGPLVAPLSFRQPTMIARMASAIDDLSGGRMRLGLGAGWQEREHQNYGWDLLDLRGRFDRLEEGLAIISHLLQKDEPLDFDGRYFKLRQAVLLPRPQRPGGPPLTVGGNGPRRTLPLVAQFAAEWNCTRRTPSQFAERNALLDEILAAHGRRPDEVRRSMMTGCFFGRDEARLREKLAGYQRSAAELRELGTAAGTAPEIVDQLGAWAEVGLQRIMLQWLDLDDIDGLEALGHLVLPQVH